MTWIDMPLEQTFTISGPSQGTKVYSLSLCDSLNSKLAFKAHIIGSTHKQNVVRLQDAFQSGITLQCSTRDVYRLFTVKYYSHPTLPPFATGLVRGSETFLIRTPCTLIQWTRQNCLESLESVLTLVLDQTSTKSGFRNSEKCPNLSRFSSRIKLVRF